WLAPGADRITKGRVASASRTNQRKRRTSKRGIEGPPKAAISICALRQPQLISTGSRRVRLVVRTQPSQGWCTGSTPVRAATLANSDNREPRQRWNPILLLRAAYL